MIQAEIEALKVKVHDNTATAMSTPIYEVLEYLNKEGYLRKPAVKIEYTDIRKGDRIHLVFDYGDSSGPTEEIYKADCDQDPNGWSLPDPNFTFYLLDRPERPKINVVDLEPGTAFTGKLLDNIDSEEFILLKGSRVLQVASADRSYYAVNSSFTVEKVHN